VILYQLENEFDSQFTDPIKKISYYPSIEYMEALEKVSRENGIDIPTFTNAPSQSGRSWSKDYSNVGGEQDMYGLDSYPQCWSCDKSECTQWGQFATFVGIHQSMPLLFTHIFPSQSEITKSMPYLHG
jgi:hypothetical protein